MENNNKESLEKLKNLINIIDPNELLFKNTKERIDNYIDKQKTYSLNIEPIPSPKTDEH